MLGAFFTSSILTYRIKIMSDLWFSLNLFYFMSTVILQFRSFNLEIFKRILTLWISLSVCMIFASSSMIYLVFTYLKCNLDMKYLVYLNSWGLQPIWSLDFLVKGINSIINNISSFTNKKSISTVLAALLSTPPCVSGSGYYRDSVESNQRRTSPCTLAYYKGSDKGPSLLFLCPCHIHGHLNSNEDSRLKELHLRTPEEEHGMPAPHQ